MDCSIWPLSYGPTDWNTVQENRLYGERADGQYQGDTRVIVPHPKRSDGPPPQWKVVGLFPIGSVERLVATLDTQEVMIAVASIDEGTTHGQALPLD